MLGPILFSFFISDVMLFINETEVSNLADDIRIYSCSLNHKEANQKTSNDMHTVLSWFRINSMVANP